MLRLSKMTDYAAVLMTHLAEAEDRLASVSQLSAKTGVPEPTAAKLLKQLSRAGLVSAERGASGGYRLTRPADRIAISDVIAAIEGPIALTACVEGATDRCSVEHLCPMRGNWNRVNLAIKSALDAISLAEMAGGRAAPAAFAPAAE